MKKNFFMKFRSKLRNVFLVPLFMFQNISCSSHPTATSEVLANTGGFKITGRKSMASDSPFQCYKTGSYTGPEKVNGRWIAGVDGSTLGYNYDATASNQGPHCGRTFSLTINGKCEEFIVADRIWENDGNGGNTYGKKEDADKKVNPTGAGYLQLDIAVGPFQSLFNDQNASDGFDFRWETPCGGASGGVATQSFSSPIGSANQQPGQWTPPPTTPAASGTDLSGCSYADAAKYQGYGWNPTTQQSCPPLQAGQTVPWNSAPTPSSSGTTQVLEQQCQQGNRFCSGGWGWENPGENQCGPDKPGWKQNGCSCRC
jgi:hypothetical protein